MRVIRIGTRRSDLASTQAKTIRNRLAEMFPRETFLLVPIGSDGDKDRKTKIQYMGQIGVFTKEGSRQLELGKIDIVVHSLKDLPTSLPASLTLAAVPMREDPSDVLCGITIAQIFPGCRVGTGSLRRRAQLLSLFPEVKISSIRGNVPPRLRKAQNKEGIDATILAAAGLNRLGLRPVVFERLDPIIFPYAVGQGALGLETRSDDKYVIGLLKALECESSRQSIDAERSMLHALGAGCSLPVGVRSCVTGGTLTLYGRVTTLDGKIYLEHQISGKKEGAIDIGNRLANRLIELGAKEILESIERELE